MNTCTTCKGKPQDKDENAAIARLTARLAEAERAHAIRLASAFFAQAELGRHFKP